MLTLSQLLVLTESDKRRFKVKYTLDSINRRKASDNIGDYLQFVGLVLGGNEPRKSVIRMYAQEPDVGAMAKVSCSCPYFRIRLAPVLYTMGATDLNVRDEDIPEKFRSLRKPGLCPHLLHLAEAILSPDSTETERLNRQSARTTVMID